MSVPILDLPAAPWLPDQPDLANPGASGLQNVVPLTAESYGPLNSYKAATDALDGPCLGAFSVQDSSGQTYVFAGTAGNLWMLEGTSTTWANVSADGGYNTTAGEAWHFAQFKDQVIATNFGNRPQVLDLTSGATQFSDLSPIGGVGTAGSIVSITVTAPGGFYATPPEVTVTDAVDAEAVSPTCVASVLGGLLTGIKVTSPGSGFTEPVVHISGGGGSGATATAQVYPQSESGGYVPPTPSNATGTGAPQGRFAAVVKSFAVLGNTSDPVGGVNPARLWWSAQNDPLTWPEPGSDYAAEVSSDYEDVPGALGDITGIVSDLTYADAVVLFQRGIYRMVFTGPPDVFDFYPAENTRGTRWPNSIVSNGGMIYYFGEDGFYSFDGISSQPIGTQAVNEWFLANADLKQLQGIIGMPDAQHPLIYWLFCSVGTETGIPDQMLIYNWAIQRWAPAALPAQWLVRVVSGGVSLEQIDALYPGGIDSVPVSLDSPQFMGGELSTGVFGPDNTLGYLTGPELPATITTREMEPAGAQGLKVWISGARPRVDGWTGAGDDGDLALDPARRGAGSTISVALGVRNRQVDAVTLQPGVPLNPIGMCPQRADARYVRAQVQIPAGQAWKNMSGVSLTLQASGVR